jgi:hypothetical protein
MGLVPLDDRGTITTGRQPVSHTEPILTQLRSPVSLAWLLVVPLFVIGRRHGWVAQLPLWVLVGSLAVAQLASLVAGAVWPNPQRRVELWARVGVIQLGIGVCIYAIGWGATLALGFVFGGARSWWGSGRCPRSSHNRRVTVWPRSKRWAPR